MTTEVAKYNAQNLALIKDEIQRLQADLRLLNDAVEQAETANSPVARVHLEWTLSNAAAKIREKRLLGDRKKCHIVQISPRRYSVIRLTNVLGQNYCEFDLVKPNLEWREAKLYTECENTRA